MLRRLTARWAGTAAAGGWRPTVKGCASLVLDVNRFVRPALAALGGRLLRASEILEAGPMRFACRREGEAEPWAAVAVALELAPDRGHARLALEHRTRRREIRGVGYHHDDAADRPPSASPVAVR